MNDIVKRFYDDIVNSKDFNGDYFQAMIDAIILARAFDFILRRLDNER